MSFFGASNNTAPTPLAVAKIETEILTEMFNKMSVTCFKKCVGAYHDGELNVGEMTCIDRCVNKYLLAHEKVMVTINQYEEMMKKQEEMGLKVQQNYKFGPGTK